MSFGGYSAILTNEHSVGDMTIYTNHLPRCCKLTVCHTKKVYICNRPSVKSDHVPTLNCLLVTVLNYTYLIIQQIIFSAPSFLILRVFYELPHSFLPWHGCISNVFSPLLSCCGGVLAMRTKSLQH